MKNIEEKKIRGPIIFKHLQVQGDIDLSTAVGEIELSKCTATKNIRISSSVSDIDLAHIRAENLQIFAGTGNVFLRDIQVQKNIEIHMDTSLVSLQEVVGTNLWIHGQNAKNIIIERSNFRDFDVQLANGKIILEDSYFSENPARVHFLSGACDLDHCCFRELQITGQAVDFNLRHSPNTNVYLNAGEKWNIEKDEPNPSQKVYIKKQVGQIQL